jgi:hypothetical protein
MRWRYVEAQAIVLLNDGGFVVLDRERSDVDSKLGGKRQRLVRRERRPRRQRHALGQSDWCLRSVRHPASTTARSAASTARGASRSFWQWAAPPPLARVKQAERPRRLECDWQRAGD